jgi:hypothetical protein
MTTTNERRVNASTFPDMVKPKTVLLVLCATVGIG